MPRSPKASWVLTPESFERFLNWLDEGTDSGGERYEEMRRRLIHFFDRKNCRRADELSDETLNRVARRLEEEGSIATEAPAKYCYITARYVFLEQLRSPSDVPLEEVVRTEASLLPSAQDEDQIDSKERLLTCLDECTTGLPDSDRDLISSYYVGKGREKIENRVRLADRLGTTANAIAIRALRIRVKLEKCVSGCISR